MKLESVIHFLNSTLELPGFPDYDRALNGLQVEGTRPVRKVGAAVDASRFTIEAAIEKDVDLLLVHHGIYWDGFGPMTGRRFRRVAPLIRSGAALYAAHLPLDAHPELGNCALLAKALELEIVGRFGRFSERDLGFEGRIQEDRKAFRERVATVVDGPVRLIPGGAEEIRRVGVVTGGGASFIGDAAEAGLDALVTGEGAHHTYLDAMELGVNVYFAGHYATETWGVRALAERAAEEFDIDWEFLDFPTGL